MKLEQRIMIENKAKFEEIFKSTEIFMQEKEDLEKKINKLT